MPRNGSGTYSRTTGVYTGATSWTQTRDGSRKIRVDDHDAHDQDIADAISASLSKDGQTTPTANLPMGGFAHTNVANATARTQYAKVSQAQDASYIYLGTTGGTANAQTGSMAPAVTALVQGMKIRFKAGVTNTGAATLDVNGTGAVAVQLLSGIPLQGGELTAGLVYEAFYESPVPAWVLMPQGSTVIKRDKTGGTVSNSTTETTLTTYTLPAFSLQAFRVLRYSVFGVAANSSGSGIDFTFRIKFGGTTYFSNLSVIGTGASYPFVIDGEIIGVSNSAQKAWARVSLNAANTTYASASLNADITTTQAMAITGQMGTASASASIAYYASTMELI